MKKAIIFLFLAILLVSIAAINAESGYSDNSNNKTNIRNEIKKDVQELKKDIRELKEDIKERRKNIKELVKENKGEYIANLKGKNITIREVSEDKREMIIEKINAKTGLNLTVEDLDNETMLGAWLSNGRHAIIKVMPNTASQKAIERLKLKVCSETNNCSIELKEVGIGNKTKLAYEIKAEEERKILFLFKNRMKVIAQVNGETGEVISVKRPWWSFLAKKQD